MRNAFWILSTPLLIGSLAWVVGAADDGSASSTPGASGAVNGPKGKMVYFPKSTQATPATDNEDEAASPAQPQRYSRNRADNAQTKTPQLRNYSKELFGDDEPPARTAHPVATTKPAPTAKATARGNAISAIENVKHEESSDAEAASAQKASPNPTATSARAETPRKSKVVTAKYEQKEGAATNKQIQQVAHKPAASAPAAGSRGVRQLPAESAEEKAALPAATQHAPRAAVPHAAAETGKPQQHKLISAHAAEPAATEPAAASNTGIETESPTGWLDTPTLNLRWTANGEITVGQECKCGLAVKNNGKTPAKDIIVEAYFPRTVRLLSAEPSPSDSHDHLTWNLDCLAPGEEKIIGITMIPAKRGDLATSATVRFSGVAANVLKVEEPQLTVAVKGAQDVAVGESATQTVIVSNPGTGVTRDVVVQALVPEGLEHSRGKKVQMAIGSLNPGESREIRLALTAIGGGEQVLVVEARAGSSIVRQAESQIRVTVPRLEVGMTGPGLRYVNRHAQYTVSVTNKGAAASNNVRVTEIVPQGFEFVKADKGGSYNSSNRNVNWFVGRLEPGQSTQVQVELTAQQPGMHQHQAQVVNDSGAAAEAAVETKVDSAAAVVMEVVDLDDPVEVKSQTAYEIRVRNDGSKAAQNVGISCQLPAGVELLKTEGPTAHRVEKGAIVFQPCAEIAPGKAITYKVHVVGTISGNLRFRARLTSNSTPDPIIVEEQTKFYAD